MLTRITVIMPFVWMAFGIGGGPIIAESGLKEEVVEFEAEGTPVVWADFQKGQPASIWVAGKEVGGQARFGQRPPGDFWAVRHPGWTPSLLNVVGRPPDLTLDPQITGTCDIFLGLRAVHPSMVLGIRLSSEKEFTTITAPAAAPKGHFDYEFNWKLGAPMEGEKIVVRAMGKPFYLEYVKFVPHVRKRATIRVPEEHVTLIQEKGRHFAFPGVAELPNGDLLVVCREGDAHVCARGRIVMTRSSDGGKTWSPREVICDTPSDERDPAVLCLKDGTVVVSFGTWDSWRGEPSLRDRYSIETARMEKDGWGKYSGSRLMISKDNGKTWMEPRRSPVFSPHGPVAGPEGALYWVGERSREGNLVVEIYRTADLGQTWTRHGEVSCWPDGGEQPASHRWDEPNLILLPDGRSICTIRVEMDGYVRQSYSGDGGKTWSWPRRLPVWGFPQQLCRLSDGRVLMSYGYRREPSGIRACLSRDEGRTWDLSREIVLRHGGGSWDLGYPYSLQLKDGRVFTVYYYNQEGSDCYIEGAFYTP